MLPLNQALEEMLGQLPAPSSTETLPLNQCANRILAEDIFSPINVPSFDNSAMDGYALRFEDLEKFADFRVIGKSFAGNPFTGQIQAGECVRIMTGAMIPAGADVVIMQEQAEMVADDRIRFNAQPKCEHSPSWGRCETRRFSVSERQQT